MDWFTKKILYWSEQHGRRDLPWQGTDDPYKVWVAEIMLQQTQVETVIPFYLRFIEKLPTLNALANTSEETVLDLWSGLGYYRRARFLYRAAGEIRDRHEGTMPSSLESLTDLPGIGASTAGGIRAGGFGLRGVILDGNVKRVLARFHAVPGKVESSKAQKVLWHHAKIHTPKTECAKYAQSIMDFGATWCTRSNPRCDSCPLQSKCVALAENNVDGYPQKNRKATQPRVSLKLLVIMTCENLVLLKKRSIQGIWPGLWMPPEIHEDHECLRLYDAINLNPKAVLREFSLKPFQHVLSHRRIEVITQVVEIERKLTIDNTETELKWCRIDEEPSLGVPKITLKIFDSLQSHEGSSV